MATVAAPRPGVAPASTGPAHPYTCNTCQVAFRGSDLQRSHMQSDWHRYNLKRRVASLPPLTAEIFAEKVLANQASAAATAAKASFEKICAPCQRTYYSQNAYDNHLNSQKHKQKLAQMGTESMTMSVTDDASSTMSSTFSLGEPLDRGHKAEAYSSGDEDFTHIVRGINKTSLAEDQSDEEGTEDGRTTRSRQHHTSSAVPSSIASDAQKEPLLHCLFCNLRSQSMEANVKHMETTHSMFIPERGYLVDLEGLVEYLHTRVFGLHECLYCGSTRNTPQAAQTHMRDKGHTMIAFESEEEMIEVGQFYDFRSTYSDYDSDEDEEVEEHRKGSRQPKLGAKRSELVGVVTNNNGDMEVDEDNEEWEDESDEQGTEDDDEDADGNESRSRDRPIRGGPRIVAYRDDYELHMPSGRMAGHRSLARYYRQNLHSYPTPAERLNQKLLRATGEPGQEQDTDSTRRGRQLVSRANGGIGLLNAPEHQKRLAKAVELKERKRQTRAEMRFKWGNEKQANNQKHFRDPILQ